MNSIQDAMAFYDQNYRVVCSWTLRAGEKVILGNKENQSCRFCGKKALVARFRVTADTEQTLAWPAVCLDSGSTSFLKTFAQ